MGDLQQAIVAYGPLAIFLGAAFEGQAAVIAGGFLAHQNLVPLWLALACAAAGSGLIDQGLFLAGRHFRSARLVVRAARSPGFARALGFIERHPVSYVFAFRYLVGLRLVSPIALGITAIPSATFALLNAAAAVVWAGVFTGLGYGFGQTIETTFHRYQNLEHRLVLAAIVLGAAAALFYLGRWAWPHIRSRFQRES